MIGIVCAFFHTEGKGFYSKEQKIKREFVASLQLKLFFKQQTIIEQILKIAQNYPTISKTASSDDPFFIKA